MFRKPKGTKDYYGDELLVRKYVLNIAKNIVENFSFKEIELPIFEKAEIFTDGLGNSTDIVNKEMYIFKDKKQRELALRPEGTAGFARAVIENKILSLSNFDKLYYHGPMFRYENTQKGRMRQFTQFGVEFISERTIYNDFEIIMILSIFFKKLNIDVNLKINSIGDFSTRSKYSEKLKEYFSKYSEKLTDLSRERLGKNPLRILDDKIDGEKDFVKNAPLISDFYSDEMKSYVKDFIKILDENNINYNWENNLVRGLDYYNSIVFEFTSKTHKSNQNALAAGGRYDNLLGMKSSSMGFAFGLERIVNEIIENNLLDIEKLKNNPDVYVGSISKKTIGFAFDISNALRKKSLHVKFDNKHLKLNKIFDKSSKLNSNSLIIIGEEEMTKNTIKLKIKNQEIDIKLSKNWENKIIELIGGK